MAAQEQKKYPDYKIMLVYYRCYSSCEIILDYLHKISRVDACIDILIKNYNNIQVYEYNKQDLEILKKSIISCKKIIIKDMKKIFTNHPEYRLNIIYCLINKEDAHINHTKDIMIKSLYNKIGNIEECNEFIYDLVNA